MRSARSEPQPVFLRPKSLDDEADVFIQWDAEDTKKIYEWNYEATKVALQRAVSGTPTIDEVLAQEAEARHPFAGGHEG